MHYSESQISLIFIFHIKSVLVAIEILSRHNMRNLRNMYVYRVFHFKRTTAYISYTVVGKKPLKLHRNLFKIVFENSNFDEIFISFVTLSISTILMVIEGIVDHFVADLFKFFK